MWGARSHAGARSLGAVEEWAVRSLGCLPAALAQQADDFGDDVGGFEVGVVYGDGVGGDEGVGGIYGVAALDLVVDGGEGGGAVAIGGDEVGMAALGAGGDGCLEEDLEVGAGQDDGADVAADHDDALGAGELADALDEGGADGVVARDARDGGLDSGGAQLAGDVAAVEEDGVLAAVVYGGGDDADVEGAGEGDQGGGVVGGEGAGEGGVGEGAIEGAGIHIEEAEAAGEAFADGALADAGAAVYGDLGVRAHAVRPPMVGDVGRARRRGTGAHSTMRRRPAGRETRSTTEETEETEVHGGRGRTMNRRGRRGRGGRSREREDVIGVAMLTAPVNIAVFAAFQLWQTGWMAG